MREVKINNIYSKEKVLEEMEEFFQTQGFLQLQHFIDEDLTNLSKKLKKETKEFYDPLRIRARELSLQSLPLEFLYFIEFFRSKSFISFIEKITGFDLHLNSLKIREYRHKNYKILHDDDMLKEDRIEVYFDMTQNWREEFGGLLTYTTKEEEIFYLEPQDNTLSILYRPEAVIDYLKYINNKAKNNSILRIEISFEISEMDLKS